MQMSIFAIVIIVGQRGREQMGWTLRCSLCSHKTSSGGWQRPPESGPTTFLSPPLNRFIPFRFSPTFLRGGEALILDKIIVRQTGRQRTPSRNEIVKLRGRRRHSKEASKYVLNPGRTEGGIDSYLVPKWAIDSPGSRSTD